MARADKHRSDKARAEQRPATDTDHADAHVAAANAEAHNKAPTKTQPTKPGAESDEFAQTAYAGVHAAASTDTSAPTTAAKTDQARALTSSTAERTGPEASKRSGAVRGGDKAALNAAQAARKPAATGHTSGATDARPAGKADNPDETGLQAAATTREDTDSAAAGNVPAIDGGRPDTARQAVREASRGDRAAAAVEALQGRRQATATDQSGRHRRGKSASERGTEAAARGSDERAASPAMPVHEIEVNLSEQVSAVESGSAAESGADGGGNSGMDQGESLTALLRSEGPGSPAPAARDNLLQQAAHTLTRRLNGELGDSIVRQAKVMLRDAESAEIRLVIRPPELGRVRIQLQVENGHIAGRILVDNGNVRELMEQNLSALQRAFEDAGMELGDLDVSTGDARDERDAQHASAGRAARGNRATAGADSLAQSVTRISEYEPGRHRINLVA